MQDTVDDHDHVAPAEQRVRGRVPQPLDLVVDRRVLLDERVRLRDVRLGLVVVVVARRSTRPRCSGNSSRNSFASCAASVLLWREHQRGPLHLLDQPGRGRRLAGAGRAEQHDVRFARLHAAGELGDRRGLVAARRVVADHPERADRAGRLHSTRLGAPRTPLPRSAERRTRCRTGATAAARSTPCRSPQRRRPPGGSRIAGVVVSASSVQVGAAFGPTVFPLVGPFGVAAMRQLVSAITLLAIARPPLRRIGLRRLTPALLLGVVLVGMNTALYAAVERIGLGLAVTIEFLGPLAVALATGSGGRRAAPLGRMPPAEPSRSAGWWCSRDRSAAARSIRSACCSAPAPRCSGPRTSCSTSARARCRA